MYIHVYSLSPDSVKIRNVVLCTCNMTTYSVFVTCTHSSFLKIIVLSFMLILFGGFREFAHACNYHKYL